ncbi:hypothetical protein ACIOHE_15760 [Streptomyces sp. NPDC087851]|uniref:hypothetical protein n=1 Tax=Streptomyces sp. NPDC087851 TaxID=3365810 RepID=UPI00381397F4
MTAQERIDALHAQARADYAASADVRAAITQDALAEEAARAEADARASGSNATAEQS